MAWTTSSNRSLLKPCVGSASKIMKKNKRRKKKTGDSSATMTPHQYLLFRLQTDSLSKDISLQ